MKKVAYAFVFVGLMLAFFIGAAFASEKGDWKKASELDTIVAYKDFMSKHPESKFAAEAAEVVSWKTATEPFSLVSMQTYVQAYPNGKHVAQARQIIQDEQIMQEIENTGKGEKFLIPEESFPSFIVSAIKSNPQRGRCILQDVARTKGAVRFEAILGKVTYSTNLIGPGGGLNIRPTLQGPFLPGGERSVFLIMGNVENIVGDNLDPIRLAYLRNIGLIYIGGKGRIMNHSGMVIFSVP